jgi:hypothetical protein
VEWRTESDGRFGRYFLIFRRRDRLSVTFLRCTVPSISPLILVHLNYVSM